MKYRFPSSRGGGESLRLALEKKSPKCVECCFDKQSFDLLSSLSFHAVKLPIFVIPKSSVCGEKNWIHCARLLQEGKGEKGPFRASYCSGTAINFLHHFCSKSQSCSWHCLKRESQILVSGLQHSGYCSNSPYFFARNEGAAEFLGLESEERGGRFLLIVPPAAINLAREKKTLLPKEMQDKRNLWTLQDSRWSFVDFCFLEKPGFG